MIDVSAFVKTLENKPVAVFGLGISNIAVINSLVAAGADVYAWDDNEERRIVAENAGAVLKDFTNADMSAYACLVLAPGVPLYYPEPHAVVRAAREANIELLCDIEILHRSIEDRKVIGITGTNGKSTTTALIGHVLKDNGIPVSVGGNIGTAALDLDMPDEEGVFVLELSSYQLDLCPHFTPNIGVLLNITPDHLDRHGTMEKYIQAKEQMFKNSGAAIIGVDDGGTAEVGSRVKAIGNRTVIDLSYKDQCVASVENNKMKGLHNLQNMAAAYHVCSYLGLSEEGTMKALNSFQGLPHRQYHVATIKTVDFVNDSKATNAEAAAKALASFENIFWIVGGLAKDGGLKGLEAYNDHISKAYLIGEELGEFSGWMTNNNIDFVESGSLDVAVKEAYQDASQSSEGKSVVLLSPACASFDQFASFEVRGNHFVELVHRLAKDQEAAA